MAGQIQLKTSVKKIMSSVTGGGGRGKKKKTNRGQQSGKPQNGYEIDETEESKSSDVTSKGTKRWGKQKRESGRLEQRVENPGRRLLTSSRKKGTRGQVGEKGI